MTFGRTLEDFRLTLEELEQLVATGSTPKKKPAKKEKGYNFNKTDRAELIKRQLVKEKS